MNLPRSILHAVLLLLAAVPAVAQSHAGDDEDAAIRHVIQSAYIEGMHMNMSRAQAREGFHPEFVMFVRSDEGVRRVTIEEWIGRLPPEGTPPGRSVTADISVLSREGMTAAAKAEVFFDGEHVFTDYFLLYRTDGRWRIVGKAFQSHS